MPTPTQPSLVKLEFPATVDVSTGARTIDFAVTVDPAYDGPPVMELRLEFDNGLIYSTPMAPQYAPSPSLIVVAGGVDDGSRGATGDTFSDATPYQARATITLPPSGSPGTYTLVSAALFYDAAPGDYAQAKTIAYDTDALKALGIGTELQVVNAKAPPPPTAELAGPVPGFSVDGLVRFTGKALPGAQVEVSGVFSDWGIATHLGSAVADASGNWSMTTSALDDYRFSQVTARTIDRDGNGSVPSAPLSFEVDREGPESWGMGVSRDAAGHVNGDQPVIWGFATPGRLVSVYDGDTLLGTATTTDFGNWWIVPPKLGTGTHVLTSHVADPAGRTTPDSRVAIVVDGPPRQGIAWSIASFDNQTKAPLEAAAVQRALDHVGLLFSNVLDGVKTIPLHVQAMEMAGAAAAAAGFPVQVPKGGLANVDQGVLQLSPDMAAMLADPAQVLSSVVIDTLVHEMLHVLGFNSITDPATGKVAPIDGEYMYPLGKFVSYAGDTPLFTGPNAVAVHGGPVPFSPDGAHLATPTGTDIMDTGGGRKTALEPWVANPSAPLSPLDIAILKDLGYTNRDTVVSSDGHTFLPGNGQPGHDLVAGTPGVDRLVLAAPRANYLVRHGEGNGITVTDKTGGGGTVVLKDIERIAFSDGALALDVDGAGGQLYRLYRAAFDREPDAAGIGYWLAGMDRGASLHSVADDFLGGEEFTALYGKAAGDDAFLKALYSHVLHRVPDGDGFGYWLEALEDGAGRADVLVRFSESVENRAQVIGSIQDGFLYTPHPA